MLYPRQYPILITRKVNIKFHWQTQQLTYSKISGTISAHYNVDGRTWKTADTQRPTNPRPCKQSQSTISDNRGSIGLERKRSNVSRVLHVRVQFWPNQWYWKRFRIGFWRWMPAAKSTFCKLKMDKNGYRVATLNVWTYGLLLGRFHNLLLAEQEIARDRKHARHFFLRHPCASICLNNYWLWKKQPNLVDLFLIQLRSWPIFPHTSLPLLWLRRSMMWVIHRDNKGTAPNRRTEDEFNDNLE